MEDCLKLLSKEGWLPCGEKIRTQLDKEKEDEPEIESVFSRDPKKWMLDEDIKDVARPSLPDGINSGRITTLSTPLILQVKKVLNIAAPSYNQRSDGAPRMLKIFLTDGKVSCQGIEYSPLPRFNLDVPTGTKIRLNGTVRLSQGIILLDDRNCQLLGGNVPHLLQEWRMQQMLMSHVRTGTNDDGPPPFVPFGQKIKRVNEELKKSFEQKENSVADEQFLSQRQDAIAAAAHSNSAASVFKGSGKKLEMRQPERRGRGRGQRERRTREDREEMQRPRESVSLFDYLQPEINVEESKEEDDYCENELHDVPHEKPSWEQDGIYRPPGRRDGDRVVSASSDRGGQSYRGQNSYGNPRYGRDQDPSSYGNATRDDNSSYHGHRRGGRRGRGDFRGRRGSRGRPTDGFRDIEDSYTNRRNFHHDSASTNKSSIDTLVDDFTAWPGLEVQEANRPPQKMANHAATHTQKEQWAVQDYCLAKWESSNQYYPAVIEQVIPERKAATVVFVESGVVRIVEMKHLVRDPQDVGGPSRIGYEQQPASRGSGCSTRIFTSRNRGRY